MKQTSRIILALAAVATLLLGGCSKGNKATTLSPSQRFQAASQELCNTESKVLGIVNDVSSGAIGTQSDVSTKLSDLESQLDGATHSFQKHGFADLASKIQVLSSAVGKLQTAVSGSHTAGIVAAAATIASAVSALPDCPGITPSA